MFSVTRTFYLMLKNLNTITQSRAWKLKALYNFRWGHFLKFKFVQRVAILFNTDKWHGLIALHLMVWSVCFLVSVATQIGVLYVVRIQREQVQPQLQGAENRQRQREAKLAKNISIVVGVYLILNFPVFFTLIHDQLLRLNLQTNNHYSWTETLAFFNSCTNSLICYWKNVEVRQKVKNILKKLVCP